MENDPFYENLIGKKAGLCIYLQERIQENIEKNSIKCKLFNNSIQKNNIFHNNKYDYNNYKLFSSLGPGCVGGGGTGLPAFLN